MDAHQGTQRTSQRGSGRHAVADATNLQVQDLLPRQAVIASCQLGHLS